MTLLTAILQLGSGRKEKALRLCVELTWQPVLSFPVFLRQRWSNSEIARSLVLVVPYLIAQWQL